MALKWIFFQQKFLNRHSIATLRAISSICRAVGIKSWQSLQHFWTPANSARKQEASFLLFGSDFWM